ncbi:ABC transporter ATP-binding protein [Domibacillus mangrovi]|uniref:ABC transporter n=1 Tax=Domibacillus mangrovi TaxID=1714354 RepID=A0A1Q5P2N5_9BACI|nr:ABC transporter ATP-binding protein [Domibacillus mangrovi]OKL36509.1 ABC transporter [Domibacillus mangrovi]
MSIIELNGLTKYYGKNCGIEDVTFSVEEGEIFGFIGPNGAGKSTAIRTLLNLIYPTKGSASIMGRDVVKQSQKIREFTGYLPSEVHYYEDMKVKELFTYSSGFYKKDCIRNASYLAERLELDTNRKIEDLSFGNRKKVGIVQAMLHDPKVLILDEPTSGLDPLMQNVFFDLLRETRDKGATIFFSSHYLSEVQKLCDRVAIIKEGHLIKVENMEEIRKNQFKNVSLYFHDASTANVNIDGMLQKERIPQGIRFLYSGSSRTLLDQLNNVPFDDILIEEPSLEEVFIHYYEKGDVKS